LTQAANGSGNVVLGITASTVEYEAYMKLALERPQLSKSYLAYFGDIYLSNARLLPELDIATMFHAGEYIGDNTTNPEYGGVDDLGVARILHGRMRPGGYWRTWARFTTHSRGQASPTLRMRRRVDCPSSHPAAWCRPACRRRA